ncbi:fasciclin domain-containing protein [Arenimonas daejeonensis]|uniref:fasciclin domain-containing protein n=1 Tax=Arenimonas daejeonensis TaxID=370777 RepID=UPI0011BE1B4D|nr:fasciclin domain-containing protein [Arenimonas daejeonensis]
MNTPTNNTSVATKNVVDNAAANGSFKTFGKALRESGLADTLRGAGPFTLFAPTDAAFEQLPSGRLENLLKPENKKELISILNYHVLAGRSSAAEIGKMTEARTANGAMAPIKLEAGKITFGEAGLVSTDIASSNGVLHGIDKVNIPTRQ